MMSTDRDSNWPAFLRAGDAIQWIAVGLLLEVLLFEGTNIGLTLRCLSVGVLLWAITSSRTWLVLLALQMSLFFRDHRGTQMDFSLGSMVYCLAAISLIAYICGFSTLRIKLRAEIARILRAIVEPNRQQSRDIAEFPQASRQAIAWLMRVFMSFLVVLVSVFAIMHLPISNSGRELLWYRSAHNDMTLWPGPAIVVCTAAAFVFFWQINWSQMTPQQARLYLRSVFIYCHYRDLSMIVTRSFAPIRKSRFSEEPTSKADGLQRTALHKKPLGK